MRDPVVSDTLTNSKNSQASKIFGTSHERKTILFLEKVYRYVRVNTEEQMREDFLNSFIILQCQSQ